MAIVQRRPARFLENWCWEVMPEISSVYRGDRLGYDKLALSTIWGLFEVPISEQAVLRLTTRTFMVGNL